MALVQQNDCHDTLVRLGDTHPELLRRILCLSVATNQNSNAHVPSFKRAVGRLALVSTSMRHATRKTVNTIRYLEDYQAPRKDLGEVIPLATHLSLGCFRVHTCVHTCEMECIGRVPDRFRWSSPLLLKRVSSLELHLHYSDDMPTDQAAATREHLTRMYDLLLRLCSGAS
jgi:hypothetical protein